VHLHPGWLLGRDGTGPERYLHVAAGEGTRRLSPTATTSRDRDKDGMSKRERDILATLRNTGRDRNAWRPVAEMKADGDASEAFLEQATALWRELHPANGAAPHQEVAAG
jgi:hypothetical protein